MINASHYVLRHMLRSLENGNLKSGNCNIEISNLIGAQKTFKKFHQRYPNDNKLQGIYNEFLSYVEGQEGKKSRFLALKSEDKRLKGIRSNLKELIDIRKLGGHGGSLRPGIKEPPHLR